ncbi:DUF3027 domain-containing protein [Corynebacterium macginleyi]
MRGVSKRQANPLIDSRAVRIAREALEEVGEGGIGKHRGVAGMGRNVATHRFETDMPGYLGWEWQAVIACAEGSRYVTVNEVALVPGGEALQAPKWVPYADRVLPGDLGPGDLMPPAIDDERLDGNELSAKGLADAKQRWQQEYGPTAEMAAKAHLQCRTCAFYMQSMDNFGICANEYSADGRVVHARYGCGAHSQTRVREEKVPAVAFDDEKPIYQDFEIAD